MIYSIFRSLKAEVVSESKVASHNYVAVSTCDQGLERAGSNSSIRLITPDSSGIEGPWFS